VEAGKAVGLVVATSLMVAFVPFASVVLLPLMPLPLAYLTMRRGAGVSLAAALASGVLCSVFTGPSNGVMTVLVAGVVGMALGWALRSGWGFSRTLLTGTAAAAASFALSGAATWWLTGMSVEQLTKVMEDSIKAASQLYSSAGIAQASIDGAVAEVRSAVAIIPYLLPSIAGVAGLALVCVSLALAAAVFPRVGRPLAAEFSFARFRMHWSMAYGLILSLVLLLVAPMLGVGREVVRYAGLNLFVFFQSLFFLQGLAVAVWFGRTRGLGTGARVMLYLVAVVAQSMLLLTSWAGLLDTWLDYRKRFAPRSPGSGAAPSRDAGGGSDREES
jgi:uncharacterized protein YybS (DUF2232 family)